MERDMGSAHIEIQTEERATERSTKERDPYRTLLEAAVRVSKTKELLELLQEDEDPSILDRVTSECRGKDNPLHVGALHGNVDFVRGILNRKPELTHELNSEGQSPLHLASERGHVKVVKEILSKDTDACFIRDRDGMIPLHLAAIKGRVEVLEKLVDAEPTTAFILTKRGDPILHLCEKNNEFEANEFRALKKLIDKLREYDPGLLNLRDRDDNTILHLLAAKENPYEVIEFLLKHPGVDVNAKNMDGFTPLNVSLRQNENLLPEFRIRRLLTKAGAKSDGNNSPFMGLIKKLKIPGSGESGFGESLMVVAVLMATVAFQARLSPPGGVWQDTTFNNATLPNVTQSYPRPNLVNNATLPNVTQSYPPPATLPNVTQSHPPPNLIPHNAGKSVMSYMNPSSYMDFSFRNDMTFILSLLVIQLLLASYLFKSRTLKIVAVIITSGSLVTMSFTYGSSATYISLDKQYLLPVVSISSTLLYICFIF